MRVGGRDGDSGLDVVGNSLSFVIGVQGEVWNLESVEGLRQEMASAFTMKCTAAKKVSN